MNLAKIAIRRPTFIFALLMAVIVIGLIAMRTLPVRMFPDVEFPYVVVTIQYPGAGPEEIELLVNKKVEDALSSISGIKHIYSVSQDGYGIAWIEFNLSKNPDIALQEAKDKIAEIRNDFPTDIKEPIIQKLDPNAQPILLISLRANLKDNEIYDLADDYFKKEFSRIDGVSKVDIFGGTKREIHVDIDKNKIRKHDMTLTAIAGKVALNSTNIPIGHVSKGPSDISFRTIGEFRSIKQISDVVVNFVGNDIPVTIKDIGKVNDSTEETYTLGRINIREGNQVKSDSTLILAVYKQAKSNDVKISDQLTLKVNELNKKSDLINGNPKLKIVKDAAWPVRANIKDVVATIFEGIFLAIVVVYFFLGSWRSTFITALALPNSLIGAFIFMSLFDFSINVISLMALSLTVGLLIDDAIVVRENIFRHFEEGEDPVTAAEKGTNEVALAVIATTLTVISVFLPIGFLSGIVGQFFREFGLTVVFAMIISLLDALTIAPLLSAYMITKRKIIEKKQNIFVRVFRILTVGWFNKFYHAIEKFYEKLVRYILDNKKKVLVGTLLIFFSSLYIAKFLPVIFMPNHESGEFMVSLEAKPGTSLKQLDQYYVKTVEETLMKEKEIEFTVTMVGNSQKELNTATVFVKMVPDKNRKISTNQMKQLLRDNLKGKFDKDFIISLDDIGAFGTEKPFMLMLYGADTKTLSKTANFLVDKIKNIDGLLDITTNFRSGKPERQVVMIPEKMQALGVHSVTAGMEMRAMVEGVTPAKFRENGLEYDIRVKLQDDQKDIMNAFNDIYIGNTNNKLIRLKNVSSLVDTDGPTKIYRRDRAVYISIEGNISKNASLQGIQKQVEKIIKEEKAKPENVFMKDLTYNYSGDAEQMKELFTNMIITASLSLVFIYMVLASLYESLITPFTIMIALPLAIVGGLLALYMTNQPISMFTMIGFIMLLGIVAKNSILLVDYIQQMMRKGYSIKEAIVISGKKRLRPILMTSVALSAGMLPTAMGLSEVGKFRMSMGIVVIGGIISSTVLTLLIVPAIFEYLNSFRMWSRKLLGRPEKRMIDHEDLNN
ncbi:MAG: efflux RND transporter permease subunit [Endomicrobiaceae bacterium]|nr:efflux RND transporter permease subunit [Endomicrobiaceae bacterium]